MQCGLYCRNSRPTPSCMTGRKYDHRSAHQFPTNDEMCNIEDFPQRHTPAVAEANISRKISCKNGFSGKSFAKSINYFSRRAQD